jgi:hypothetical protein
MFEFVWEFVAKEEARGQFELVYGPGGAWSKLFARCPGYRGTNVLRNTENTQRYLTIDLWKTEDQRERVLGIFLGALAIELIVVGLATLGIISSSGH